MPKKRTKGAAKSGPSPTMSAIVEYLRDHRGAEYGEVVEAVGKNGHKIYPVMYGRAQALLGIVKVKKRAKRGTPTEKAASRRGRGRVSATSGRAAAGRTGAAAELQRFLAEYEELRRERDALTDVIETIRRVLPKAVS